MQERPFCLLYFLLIYHKRLFMGSGITHVDHEIASHRPEVFSLAIEHDERPLEFQSTSLKSSLQIEQRLSPGILNFIIGAMA